MTRYSSDDLRQVAENQRRARDRRAIAQEARAMPEAGPVAQSLAVDALTDDTVAQIRERLGDPIWEAWDDLSGRFDAHDWPDDDYDAGGYCAACGDYPLVLVGDPVPYCQACGDDQDGNLIVPDPRDQ